MPKSSIPRVIFFDAAGTLIHLPRGVAWHYREVARRHRCNIPEASLRQAFGSAWQAAPSQPETRVPRPEDGKQWWRALVDHVLDLCKPHSIGLNRPAYFEELYAEFTEPEVWELYPDVEKTLLTLQSRCSLGILSNFDGRLRIILEDLGLAPIFRHWVISSEVGADKPSPWIFEHAISLAGVQPFEALHVGDDPVCDWAGAESAGLKAFKLDRPRQNLASLLAVL
jgi:putative hydrolase of the HAD superfamily